ncbi:GNAT family N-acetyltransferase [Streptomyces sp. NBC_00401]|uniref:GNAT family N-acetyltransferase n=1 Tax=unclassified Streptomyces TaxID=2593676 RepID=UPI002255A383|nr:GNAT family N-acetyltransferase [Streptomyces sp. NBC_00401]MCX5082373.1 GNAT family N-acetyltransferase [Streptomyces sp. NBC_00401]
MTESPASVPGWHLTADVDDFLARAGGYLRAEPALHTVVLSVTASLRERGPAVYAAQGQLFGVLYGPDGGVCGTFLWTKPFRLHVSPLDREQADALAVALQGRAVTGVFGVDSASAAFADAWQSRTGAGARRAIEQRLYRLGDLTPPLPAPAGRPRVATEADRELLVRWRTAFDADTGTPGGASQEWADERISYGGVTLWETADGVPVSMAGVTRQAAGAVRVAPVYTPKELRGRGYAGAVTAEVSRAARAAGASEVLLFTDLANATSNGLYLRIGYRPVRDFAVHTFTAPENG